MSYCRWSSDDYQSDVYVYEHVDGGWTTHVAGARYEFDRALLPPPIPFPTGGSKARLTAYFRRKQAVLGAIKTATLVEIGLPHDGETFNDPTPDACADRLESLRALGYCVPQRAIDRLRAEAAEHQEPP